jgi:hypothetical protein
MTCMTPNGRLVTGEQIPNGLQLLAKPFAPSDLLVAIDRAVGAARSTLR